MAKLDSLTHLIKQLIRAIDTGKYQDITIGEVKEHIEKGDIIPYLKDRIDTHTIDLSVFSASYFQTEAQKTTRGLQDILGGRGDQAWREWGVANSGLCLLVAWLAELIEERTELIEDRNWEG